MIVALMILHDELKHRPEIVKTRHSHDACADTRERVRPVFE